MQFPILQLSLLFPWICGILAQNGKGPGRSDSVFISNDGDVAFGINIPENNTSDIYFALRGRLSNTWTAVGLGQKDMKNALVLMMYQNRARTNVTLSTRISSGYIEPEWSPDFNVQALPGTGIDFTSGTLLFNGKCSNCRSWPNGSLHVDSPRESFIYGVGPKGDYIHSDDLAESVPYHAAYGWFTMDLASSVSAAAQVPDLQQGPTRSQRGKDWADQKDLVAYIHGLVAIIVFFALFPLSITVLELFGWFKAFLWIHIFTTIVALGALGVGPEVGTFYQKTRNMSTPHQIIGFIVLGFLVLKSVMSCVALCLRRKRTPAGNSTTTSVKPKGSTQLTFATHLGWLAILLGCINAFLGYASSHHTENNKILGGVLAAVIVILILVKHFGRRRRARHARKNALDQNGGVAS